MHLKQKEEPRKKLHANLLTKKTVTEEEFELASQQTNLAKLKRAISSRVNMLKTKVE